ncbi:MAG: GTP cyclohydrolase I FolE [Hyphomicrobiaceae bacterium]|nr:GTP cyclohydrolase I FolE [Hyphomicrobiaceae bacterium]
MSDYLSNFALKRKRKKPTRKMAEAAVRTLIEWAGDDPDREGLVGTPQRVVNAYEEFFAGYEQDPVAELERTFSEGLENYNDFILLRNIRFESHCEHHIVPMIGHADIAYMPNKKVVGISKLARLVEIFAKRLQTQEILTLQIADTIDKTLASKGVAVIITAAHQCMTARGIKKPGTITVTRRFSGCFQSDIDLRREFMTSVKTTNKECL